jgi:hypothetical protein
MPISTHRRLQPFDLIEFDGSTNVASVRKIQILDGQEVAVLRYVRDDGELEFVPVTMTVRALMRISTLRDSACYKNTRRPAQVGRASRPKTERIEPESRVIFQPLLGAVSNICAL